MDCILHQLNSVSMFISNFFQFVLILFLLCIGASVGLLSSELTKFYVHLLCFLCMLCAWLIAHNMSDWPCFYRSPHPHRTKYIKYVQSKIYEIIQKSPKMGYGKEKNTPNTTTNIPLHAEVLHQKWLRWSRGSVLAFGTQVRGLEPGRSHRIFQGKKFLTMPHFGGEVKLSVPCCRFAACKRSLKKAWTSLLSAKICRPYLTQ